MTIQSIYQAVLESYPSGLPINKRCELLKKLRQILINNEEKIFLALKEDLGRADFETYVAEVALIKDEIDVAIKSLKKWSKPAQVKTPLVFQPGSSYILPCPKGIVLIISPWNYPLQLSLVPLISAIAAGNAVILKPSELAMASAFLIKDIINELGSPFIKVVCGDANTANELLELEFDHIFYTGSTNVGRLIMEKASAHLTPVTLELGGKSPCIIDESADIELAAKRIMWAKCLNAGQTCIAPDYVLIEPKHFDRFVAKAKEALVNMYGVDPIKSPDLGRIINERHFDRLVSYLKDGTVHGGRNDREKKYIEPSIITKVKLDSPLMQEEIFGPLLPVIPMDFFKAIDFVKKRPHPLALYLFSNQKKSIDQVLSNTISGGVCINDCLSHVGISGLPFGGVRHSGIGSYHGVFGFNTFSHFRAVHKRAGFLDNPIKYAPYSPTKLKLAKMVM